MDPYILDKKCFPSVVIRPESITPFKGKFVSNSSSLMRKISYEDGSVFEYSRFSDMFADHENVVIVFNSVLSNTDMMYEFVSDNDDILIIIYDEMNEEDGIL